MVENKFYFKFSLLCFILLFLTGYILFFITNISYASDSVYVWSTETKPLDKTQTTNANLNTSLVNNQTTDLALQSGGAVLIEQYSGKVLYDHNMHEKLRPASVTKVMTLLLIMEQIDSGKLNYTDKIPCSENAAGMGGSQIWLDVKEELTVDEMLKAICVVSANDCTVAMAEYIAGSEEAFVQRMNEKAKELGMNDTTFKNCHGIDEDGHVTSAYDIALMSRELLTKHPNITKYTTIYMDTLRNGKSELVNTNKLIRNYKGATGLKTGSTSVALYNLSASATRDDLSLIAVIMKAPSTKVRFEEAQKLLDYGFSNFQYKKLASKNNVLKQVAVGKGVSNTVNAIIEQDAGVLIQKGQDDNITQSLSIANNVSAPITKGQKLGEISYFLNNEEIAKVNIIAETNVAKNTFINVVNYIYQNWVCSLR
jgi:D-alanyl-D-alanine carboxypeptidase (penicillin-binding protein 5/6)